MNGRQKANTLWNFGSGGAGLVSNLLLFPLGVAIVGSEHIAPWLFVWSLLQIATFADFGLGTVGIRRVTELRRLNRPDHEVVELVTRVHVLFLLIALMTTLVMVAGLYLFAHHWNSTLQDDDQNLLILIAALAVFATCIGRSANVVLWSFDRPDIERKAVLASILVKLVLIGIATCSSEKLILVALSDVVMLIIPSLICLYAALRRIGPRVASWKRMLRSLPELGSASLLVFLGGFANTILMQSPVIIATLFFGPGQVVVASGLVRLLQTGRTLTTWVVNPFIVPVSGADPFSVELGIVTRRLIYGALCAGLLAGGSIALGGPILAEYWLTSSVPGAAKVFAIGGMILVLVSFNTAAMLIINLRGDAMRSSIRLLVASSLGFLFISIAVKVGSFELAVLGVVVGMIVSAVLLMSKLAEIKVPRPARGLRFLLAFLAALLVFIGSYALIETSSAFQSLLVLAVTALSGAAILCFPLLRRRLD